MNSPATRRRLPFLVIAGMLLVLAVAAGALLWNRSAPADTPPLAGSGIGGPFALVDGDGRAVTDQSFKGQWRLMYFGYTFCPDVCPTDMQRLAQGFRAFEAKDPARAAELQPIFLTVDPARDTPAVVKAFASAFHPRFIGLTGTPAQVDAALKAFRVYANKAEGGDPKNYLMDHSAIAYLMGPNGEPVSFLSQGATAQEVTAELDKWVR